MSSLGECVVGRWESRTSKKFQAAFSGNSIFLKRSSRFQIQWIDGQHNTHVPMDTADDALAPPVALNAERALDETACVVPGEQTELRPLAVVVGYRLRFAKSAEDLGSNVWVPISGFQFGISRGTAVRLAGWA